MADDDARVPLSVLDLAPVGVGQTSTEALRSSLSLARRTEELGYRRFWVAEHHNMPGVASTSPAVLIAHLAAGTSSIRVGSGGVMLPNHPPLVVAEQFAMLEALHPGRIDLGIGRAPGTDPNTAAALRRSPDGLGADDFPRELEDLRTLLDTAPDRDPHRARFLATPAATSTPDVWLLGSSGYSAQAAAVLGLPFAFAHHFSAHNTEAALALYRETFQPSTVLDKPYAMVTQAVIVADTDAEADYLAGSLRLMQVALRAGRPSALQPPDVAAAHEWTDAERHLLENGPSRPTIGSPQTVREGLAKLCAATDADELMISTMTYGDAERLRSFELLADVW